VRRILAAAISAVRENDFINTPVKSRVVSPYFFQIKILDDVTGDLRYY